MHRFVEIIEKNRFLLLLWGIALGLGTITTIAMMAELIFPE